MNKKIYSEFGRSDKVKVFDLMDHLRNKFNDHITKNETSYIDAMMGVHNFHKMTIQLATEPMFKDNIDRAAYYQIWKDTFNKSMNELIDGELAKSA